jgi:hypothetical protein
VAETPREGSPPRARHPARRIFAGVLLATLVVDIATALLFAGPPTIPLTTGLGRWLIGLTAGFMGMRRTGSLPRTVAAACGGMVLGTLLTDTVYVLTGRAAADLYGPAAVVALLLAGTAIALVAPTAGALAALAVGRLRPRGA